MEVPLSVLAAAAPCAIPLVAMFHREVRQPGFAADGPELIGRLEPVDVVEGAEIELDLVGAAGEDLRAAAGQK